MSDKQETRLSVHWVDGGRAPKHPPNPSFPQGRDMDVSQGATKTCSVELWPYPAPRIGIMLVTCEYRGLRVGFTTAGRPDDPKSAKLAGNPKMTQ